MEESSYQAGYLAADYSTTKIIGTYGGEKIDVLVPFMTGYYNGAMAWAEDNGQDVTVIGWDPATQNGDFVNSWTDSGIAKSISLAQLEAGADVIYPVAGGLFGATAEAIKETGANAVMLGVDADVALTSPQFADVVLTSVEKRMTNATFDIVKDTLESGVFNTDTYLGTLANGGTGISDFYDFDSLVSDGVKTRLAELAEGIISGNVKAMP
jgi:basic membrane protein A